MRHCGRVAVAVAPVDRTEPVFMDRYEDGWADVSASLRYRLSHQFQLWVDVTNLTGGTELDQYLHSRAHYPVGTDYRSGRMFNMGIRFSL